MIRQVLENEARFDGLLKPYRMAADRVMFAMCLFLSGVCMAISPIYGTWSVAALVSSSTLAMGWWLWRHMAGSLLTRIFMACAFMTYTALIIHQTNGSIEAHFSAFGLIGILLYYRDWRVILAATVFIYMHHLVLGYLQTLGLAVYVFDNSDFWRKFLEHVAYFLPFVGLLGYLAISFRREAFETERVIHLAKQVVEGEFSADPQGGLEGDNSGLLASVTRMRNSIYNLLRHLPVAAAVIRLDDRRLLDANETFGRMFGLNTNLIRKQSLDSLPIWEADADISSMVRQFDAEGGVTIELAMTNAGGSSIQINLSGMVLENEQVSFLILTFDDITLRREAEKRMHELAYFDWLTGINNRAALMTYLSSLIEGRRNSLPFGLILIDLDDFKPVNDLYGHEAGDAVLKVIAARMKAVVSNEDFPARLGGDEFVLVLPQCADLRRTVLIGERLLAAISDPIPVRDNVVCRVGATLGVCWYDGTILPQSAEQALGEADEALYQGKGSGKNVVSIHRSIAHFMDI